MRFGVTWQDNILQFHTYTVVLLVYSVIEIQLLFRKIGRKALLSPVVLGTAIMFMLNFGVTNFFMTSELAFDFTTFYIRRSFGYRETYNYWMAFNAYVVCLCFLTMWVGYYATFLSQGIRQALTVLLGLRYFHRQRLLVSVRRAFLFIGLGISTKLLKLSLGIYGYTAATAALNRYSAILSPLKYLEMVSTAGLLFLAFHVFSFPKDRRALLVLVVATTLEVLFGILSGFKYQVVAPVLVVAIAYLLHYQRLPFKFILPGMVVLFLAYQVVEPFRKATGYGGGKQYSTTELVSKSLSATASAETGDRKDLILGFFTAISFRTNLSVFSALSMKLGVGDRRFFPDLDTRRQVLLSPVLAYVPRAVWPSKPVLALGGGIFTQQVLRRKDDPTSVTPGPFGYIALSTGSVGWMLAFFLVVGVAARIVFYFYEIGGGGWILYLGLLPTFLSISEPQMFFVNLFKDTPVLLLAQFFLIAGAGRSAPPLANRK